jgi:hypothetical protein
MLPTATDSPLLDEVCRQLRNMRTTRYRHTTTVREDAGEYVYDCSGLLDYALYECARPALLALPTSTKLRPLARDYVAHLRRVADGLPGPWTAPASLAELRPGDVIAWLTPSGSSHNNTGHVVVVLEPPVRNPARPAEWLVRIVDATSTPHTDDSRDGRATGLGTGTIGLLADEEGHPVAYYWRGGVSPTAKYTVMVLGRLV